MFSGDREGTLKVWDLASGTCTQTINHAHGSAVTKILVWGENYLLTSSLDGFIKCWSPGSPVVNPEPEFIYDGTDQEQQQQQQQRNPPNYRANQSSWVREGEVGRGSQGGEVGAGLGLALRVGWW